MSRLSIVRAVALAVLAVALAPVVARADDASTVTIVGTSDVSDSNLMAGVLKPGFEAAYPQYHVNYVPLGTGAAIAFAEAGSASGLIVHAASLENQFVDQGYSNEQYGRALFYGDYVLLGPAADPAHVFTDAPHDMVTAFEKISAAGVAGHATYVSRGGTPGTTVEEHAIWALTSGVTTCVVSDANGGGTTPSTTTGNCPGTNPSWYKVSGLQQGPNLDVADTCNFPNGNCYVLTDRGTFLFKQSQHQAQNLGIVGRNNDAGARGGANLLVNSFHAYTIKPSKVPSAQINVAGMTTFLDWATSPGAQALIKQFFGESGDSPFLPSASPALSGVGLPATVAAGTPVTVAGTLRNVVPGTPVLAGETVTLATPAGPVGTATTDAAGNYSLTFTPLANASYSVSTKQIAKVEIAAPTLNPVFGDLLSPASAAVGSMTVQSSIAVSKITTGYRRATVTGTVTPGGPHANASVTISARRGSSGAFRNYANAKVTAGTFSIPVKLPPGTWHVQARFDDPTQVLSSVAAVKTVKVPGASSVKIAKVTVGAGGDVTLTGSVSPTPGSSGGYVEVRGRHTKRIATASATLKLATIGRRVKLAKGRSTFSITVHVKRGYRWQLQVRYVHKGQIDMSDSKTRTVSVR
jgi:tungstate transport system substrate-binding protein